MTDRIPPEVEELLGGGPSPELLAGLADEASAEGLVDVAWAHVDSPFGKLLVAGTERGLIRLAYPERSHDDVLSSLSSEVSPRILEVPARLDDVRRQLDEYFGGVRRDFDLRIDWSFTRGFPARVLEATARIAYGEVRTYREVAAEAGNERAVRAAGNGLGSNRIPIVVPCHRVVRTGGGMGGYTGGVDRKLALLELERGG